MAEAQSNSGSAGWIAGIAIIGLLLVVGMCSTPKDKAKQSFVSPTLSNQIDTMVAPPAAAEIAPLSMASVRKGRQHLAAAIRAEGLSGAMIYSQNCYDALSRAFSWAKLDLCGGFDMLAVKTVDNTNTQGLGPEAEYFGSEAAAGRYLAVATKTGEAAEDADKRLDALQRRVAGMILPAPGGAPAVEKVPAVDEPASEDGNAEEATEV